MIDYHTIEFNEIILSKYCQQHNKINNNTIILRLFENNNIKFTLFAYKKGENYIFSLLMTQVHHQVLKYLFTNHLIEFVQNPKDIKQNKPVFFTNGCIYNVYQLKLTPKSLLSLI